MLDVRCDLTEKARLPNWAIFESSWDDPKTSYRPGGGETLCPAQMAVRLAADLRLSADGSAVRT